MKKYNGNSCKNARIKIDYNGLNPKVNFSYPDKKNQETYSMFPTIFSIWLGILLLIFFSYSLYESLNEEVEEIDLNDYGSCLVHYQEYCESRDGKTEIDLLKSDLKDEFLTLNNLFFLLLIILPPLLIYYPFKEYWANVFPKYQARGSEGKLAIFKPRDIKEETSSLQKEEDKYFVEIPLFKNIMLEYDAKKDFSKHLSYFEIREYDFKYVKGRTIKKAMKSKKSVNEQLWYARFYFNEKPLDGKLVVLFK